MEKKYHVFLISPCTCYPVVPGISSNSDIESLKALRDTIIKLKPGYGKFCALEVLEVDGFGSPTFSSHTAIEMIRNTLGTS
jgi:hypothetical protein